MCTVHVRVGHDDDAVIAKLVDVVIVLTEARLYADERHDLFARNHFVEGAFSMLNTLPRNGKIA